MIFKFKDYGRVDFSDLDGIYKKWISVKQPNFVKVYPYFIYSILDLNYFYNDNIMYLKKQIFNVYIKDLYNNSRILIKDLDKINSIDYDLTMTAGAYEEYYTTYDLSYCSLKKLIKYIFNYDDISKLKKKITYYHPYSKKNNKEIKFLFNYNKNIFPVQLIIKQDNIYYGFIFDCIVDTYIKTTDIEFSLSKLNSKLKLKLGKLNNLDKYTLNNISEFTQLIQINKEEILLYLTNLIINTSNFKSHNKEFKLFLITGWNDYGESDTELNDNPHVESMNLDKAIDVQPYISCYSLKDVYVQNLSDLEKRGFILNDLEWIKDEKYPISFNVKGKFNNTQIMNMLTFHVIKKHNDYIFKANWTSEFRMLSTNRSTI